MPASRLYMKSMFDKFDTRIKNWSPGDGGQVCITKAKWAVLEKVAVRNDIGSDYLKKWVRFESF